MALASARLPARLALWAAMLCAMVAFARAAPPPPPNAATGEWYVSPVGQALGPFAIPALVEMAGAGKLARETPAWKEGMAKWALLGDIAELAPVVAAIPVRAAAPPPPPDTQRVLNEKLQAFLLGTWRYEGVDKSSGYPIQMTLEITYRADGSYAGIQTMAAPGAGGIAAPPTQLVRSGQYQITAIDEQNFAVTSVERGGGQAAVSLKVIDQNTIEDTATLNRHTRVR